MRPPTTPVQSAPFHPPATVAASSPRTTAHREPVSPVALSERRAMLAPPSTRPHRTGRVARLRHLTSHRSWMAAILAVIVLAGGTLASAASRPDTRAPAAPAAAAQPAVPPDQPPIPLPPNESVPCGPDTPPPPLCSLPAPSTSPPATGFPLPTGIPAPPSCDPALPLQPCATSPPTTSPTAPCSGEGCIPQPGTTVTPPAGPGTGQPGTGQPGTDDCGITDIGACISGAVTAFFRGIVTEALTPLLDLLSTTLLTTPMPDSLPRVGQLWNTSWQILLASYGLLVVLAGIIAMSYQSLHTRHSVKELAPRLVVGFLAGALSLWAASKGIEIANALVAGIMGEDLDADSVGETLRALALGGLNGGTWIVLVGIVFAGMLVALLLTYVVRVALTIILIAGAPLALMFHALPQTEGIAYRWWKAFGGCLAIQLGQSLTLITAMKVFLAPGGFTFFGPTPSGLVNLLVAIALVYILFKIPFWVLASMRGGGRGGLVGSLVKGFLAYKTFGLLGGRTSGTHPAPPTPGSRTGSARTSGGAADPYARTRTTSSGQYMLPLPGVRRTRAAGAPTPASGSAAAAPSSRGRQLALPLGEDWPENRPVLGRDGQYRLPFTVRRTTAPTPTASGDGAPRPVRPNRREQPELPFDPYQGIRATRSGQYPLPLGTVPRVPRPPNPAPPAPRHPAGRKAVQPELPFDPFSGIRATRSGQYPLPLDGLRRTPPPRPAPVPPPASPRRAPRGGRQTRLPLDLPAPTPPPPSPSSSPSPPRPTQGGNSS